MSRNSRDDLRRVLPLLAMLGSTAFTACSETGTSGTEEAFNMRLPQATTIVSLESELIGSPTHIDLDDSGRVWIADAISNRLLVVDPDGGVPRFIGREGEGPGEFRSPASVAASDSLIAVIDARNSRVQRYRPDGTHVSDHLIPDPMIGGGALSQDQERVLVPTSGQDEALARLYSLTESSPRLIGSPIVPPGFWHFTAMKAEIAEGRVPDQFRNTATPIFGADDRIWLLVQTEAEVRRYDANGDLLWTQTLDVPEIEESRREFFRRNTEERNPSVIIPLSTMATAREVDGELWVLLQAEAESQTAVFYILDPDTGHVSRRVTAPVPAAVNQFAIDPQRKRLYLAVPGEASVIAAALTNSEQR